MSTTTRDTRARTFTTAEWSDWRWQIRNSLRTLDDLAGVINLDADERDRLQRSLGVFSMAVTPYYASLMDRDDPDCPVRKQAVPSPLELVSHAEDLSDSTAEDLDSPTARITHRYPDRVLFALTDLCSMYCRHCTRRRHVGSRDAVATRREIDDALTYIGRSPEVRDVLISGGDPLTLSDDALEDVLARVRAIPHVEVIRIGTRMPVVCPMRITPELVGMLRKYHPVYLNTHFNTPKELTEESREACARIVDAGIPMGNQSVLLRGVNDCPHVMRELVQGLMGFRVRPYYIYQCDLEPGIAHFRTSVSQGVEIIENLRGHTSGLAVPWFIVEAVGGGGKTPVMPEYVISRSARKIVLRSYEGVISSYTEPDDYRSPDCSCDACRGEKAGAVGVAGLLAGDHPTLDYATEKRYEKVRVRKDRMTPWRAGSSDEGLAPGEPAS